MKDSINPIVEAIDRLRGNESRSALCERAQLSRDFLRKLEERGPKASAHHKSLEKIANALGVAVSDLTAKPSQSSIQTKRGDVRPTRMRVDRTMTRDLPVFGTASGAVANGFHMTGSVVDIVNRPPALAEVDDAYAIYVEGDSMAPLHRPGDLCVVHPGRPCVENDSVVLYIDNGDGEPVAAYIKTFVRTSGDWVVTRQYNPPSEVKFKRRTVAKMHHVMTMKELFG